MKLIRTQIVGFAALALTACGADEERGRSTAKLSEIEWTLQASGQTTIGSIEIGYQGDQVKDVAFRENGMDAGRMEFQYAGGKVQSIDMIDAEGDQGSYAWTYSGDRLKSILWAVPQVVSFEQEFEYDDAAEGRPRRVTSTTSWVGATPTSMIENYDYDEEGRLEEIAAVQGSTTSSSEIRYDEESRIERFTEYTGNDFTNADLSYDDEGRLALIDSNDNDRHEITYDADGRIDEILVLAPSTGEALTVRYSYAEGSVTGLTFNPNLPVAGLIDLQGIPFDQAAFTALAAPLQLGDVPRVEISSGCTHDVCDVGAALASSCSSCAATVCNQDSFCCTSSWDDVCVQTAESLCGFTC